MLYAPHIRALSAPLGAVARPLRYTLSANGALIRSDVRYAAPLLGSGWLSAEGRLVQRADGDGVDVLFDAFWWRPGGDARVPPVTGASPVAEGSVVAPLDALVNAIGRAAFFPSLSRFPVNFLQVDDRAGLTIFTFPPLRTTIAAARVATPVPAGADNSSADVLLAAQTLRRRRRRTRRWR